MQKRRATIEELKELVVRLTLEQGELITEKRALADQLAAHSIAVQEWQRGISFPEINRASIRRNIDAAAAWNRGRIRKRQERERYERNTRIMSDQAALSWQRFQERLGKLENKSPPISTERKTLRLRVQIGSEADKYFQTMLERQCEFPVDLGQVVHPQVRARRRRWVAPGVVAFTMTT